MIWVRGHYRRPATHQQRPLCIACGREYTSRCHNEAVVDLPAIPGLTGERAGGWCRECILSLLKCVKEDLKRSEGTEATLDQVKRLVA